MTNLSQLKRVLTPRWSHAYEQELERALHRRRVQRRRARQGAVVVAAIACVAGAFTFARGMRGQPDLAVEQHATSLRTLSFADGTTAALQTPLSQLTAKAMSAEETRVALSGGGARFVVPVRGGRTVFVEAAFMEVRTLAARFLIEPGPAGVRVSVEDGQLEAHWGEDVSPTPDPVTLTAGQSRVFAPVLPAPPQAADADVPDPATKVPEPTARRERNRGSAWQRFARAGSYDEAYRALDRSGSAAVADVPHELLLAADVARLSGHPARAVAPLRQVLARHRTDPRAPLAAFTLGRLLLDQLGAPEEAAAAFAQSRELAPAGQLSEDALAREAEAWAAAGQADRATKLARLYLQTYGHGRREVLMKHILGDEWPAQ